MMAVFVVIHDATTHEDRRRVARPRSRCSATGPAAGSARLGSSPRPSSCSTSARTSRPERSTEGFATTRRARSSVYEIGYLSYDTRNADLLFQVVSRRYERR